MVVSIRQLPYELLSLVFETTNADTLEYDSVYRAVKTLLNLGAVCAHWRGIVRSTPILWTTIHLGTDIRLLELYLRYSSNALITVYSVDPWNTSWPINVRPLVPHVVRIAKLDLRLKPAVSTEASWYHVCSLLNCFMPSLKWLRVDASDLEHFALPPINLGLFPRLQSLILCETEPIWDAPELAQLTVLEMRGFLWQQQPTLDELLRLLSAMPHLQTCVFVQCGLKITCNYQENAAELPTRSVVPLHDVESLTLIDDARHRPLVVVLEYLSLPSTATINLTQAPRRDSTPTPAFLPDPEVLRIRHWKSRLRSALLEPERPLSDEDTLGLHRLFTIMENYELMTVERLARTHITIVLHIISSMPAGKVHRTGEFKFRQRAYVLVMKWQALFNT
ncbi:hypothetical protein DAEQUDRAFT_741342 [Daedalea quercina L-15889]|uniref:F-box domain-containing protein n=1 Tax=Daedalea quercina L-15889 TaxID=1314783 RepID=A0A165LEJ5_9APHY|nr:hypothetical protein DAEQUDRAFT_741342 [Daedalea quercina L-15889]